MPFAGKQGSHSGRGGVLALLFLLFLTVALGGGCGRGRVAAGGDVQVELKPLAEKVVGPATLEVALRDAQGQPVEGAEVSVRGDMSHAGMKPVLASSKPAGGGLYRTEGFQFTMAGDWIITATVVLPGGEKLERTFNVNGVAGR